MNKPEILKGEVKEFIDVTRDNIESIPSKIEGAFRIDYKEDADDFWILTNFYKQPFKPEMITEYFGLRADEDGIYHCNKKEFECMGLYKMRGFTLDINEDDKHSFYPIKTLSQFITNAIQANIKLIWRE